MRKDKAIFGGIHVALADADVRLHVAHEDGAISIDLAADADTLHLYLTGTPDELHWLCDKLRAVVTAHESTTRLAGEAAARVAAAATVDCVECGRSFDPAGFNLETHEPQCLACFRANGAGPRVIA